jgi:hypothetical protein
MPSPSVERLARIRPLWLLALLVAIPFVVSLPFLGGGWVTDDFMHVGHLQGRRCLSALTSPDVFGYFRPIPQVSLCANLGVAGCSRSCSRQKRIHSPCNGSRRGLSS